MENIIENNKYIVGFTDNVDILVEYFGSFELPDYKTNGAAGIDLPAELDKPILLKPMEFKLIKTGLKIALPRGLEAQVRSRSGLALKHGIVVLNAPGTIDADYRGEIGVIIANFSKEDFIINPGDRIAQLVISRYVTMNAVVVDKIPNDTERGDGGYGHTGMK